jgi:cobalt-zinc-cadmium resistance protein CzcA
MLDKIIHFSIKNKLLIGLFTLGLMAWGGYSLQQIPINAVPDITNNQVQVITVSPSLAAEEVERLITFPVEVTMATIPDIQEIRSFSRFGLSLVTIVFDEKVDVYWARQQVNERLTKAEESIPEGVGKPGMAPVTTGLGEIYQYVVRAEEGYEDRYSAMELRTIQDWVVRRQLLGTSGVADVSSFGGYLKQYEIALNPDKLKSLNISISEIFGALEDNNENTGGAYIEKNKNAYFIRSEGLVSSLDDIRNITVKEAGDGIPVFIEDVADVRYGNAVRYGATTMNGEGETVSAIVMMLKGANSAEVIRNVKEQIAEIQSNLPEGVVIEPFLDRSKLINAAIGTVTKNLLEGALIVIFILVLFLGNVRAGLIVGSVIPLALLFAFGMMRVFGVSANLMSLGALDFGLIVDGAVIIVESVVYKIQSMKNDVASQVQMDSMVSKRASEIIRPASFGVLIILIVYLPILALSGVEGKMFAPMAQTVSFALLGALLLSVTYVPMMSALALSKKSTSKRNFSDTIMDYLHKLYDPVLRWALRAKALVLILALVLFGIAFWVFSNMGGEFIPTLEEGDFAVETRVRTGSSLQRTIEATTKAQKILLDKFPEVEKVVGKIGSGEIPTDPMPIEASDLMVILKPKSEWTSASGREELASKMADELSVLSGVSFSFQQPIQMRFNELMTGSRQDVVAKIYGEDLNRLSEYANKVGEVVGTVEGAVDLYVEEVTGIPQVVVDIDRQKIAKFGLSIADVNNTVQAAFSGAEAGLVYEGEKRFDLVVRLDKDQRADISDIRQLYVVNKDGQQIPLSQVADVQIEDGPYQIQRDDTQRRIMVGFNVRNRDVESVVDEIRQKVAAEIDFDPGYSVAYGGQFENLVDAQQRLGVAVPLALLLIFILLFFAFRSLKLSLLIFTAIPLSAIGGVFALYARGMPFSISAGVGFIALFGVAVLNGIVLIDEFNKLKEENVNDLHKRILKGTSVRLRPVLMTASVASLGFLPMALSTSAGAEVQQPLATVVIGGLISATLLTLVVLPVLYYYFEKGIPNKLKKGATLLGVLMVLSAAANPLFAQQKKDTLRVFNSGQELVDFALENNPGIQAGQYNISREKALKGAAWDLPNTSFTFDRGQINMPTQTDNQIGISQQFALPFYYARRSQLAQARINASENRQVINKNDLIYQLQSSLQTLRYLRARDELLRTQGGLMQQFASAAQKRFQAGATNLLEKSTATSEAAQVQALHDQNQADITAVRAHIKSLLTISEPLTINTDSLNLMDIDRLSIPAAMQQNPELEFIRATLEIAKRKKAVEKSRLLPKVEVGFYSQTFNGPGINSAGNQTINTGSDRVNVFQVGLSIPLWFKPETARIKAAEREKLQVNAELRNRRNLLQGRLEALVQQYYKASTSIETYYKAELLPQAQLLEEQAQQAFTEGAIGYVEYSQALTRALDIKVSHLELVNQANQSLIQIKSIIGYKNL